MSLVDNRFLCLSGGAVITRHFAEVDSVQQSRLEYANTLVFGAGDSYKYSILMPTSPTASNVYITDGDGVITANRAHARLLSNGTYSFAGGMSVTVGGITKITGDTYPTDGKLYEIEYTFTTDRDVKYLASRFTQADFYSGIFADAVATISGVTTFNEIGVALLGGNAEPSVTSGPANSLQPFFINDANIEQFQLSGDTTQWDNISPAPQQLPAVIEIA